MPPTSADKQYKTKLVAAGFGNSITSVCGSVARINCATLSLLKPNWVRMKPGVRFNIMARWSENSASAEVRGFPDAKGASFVRWKVNILPSDETSQDSARSGP